MQDQDSPSNAVLKSHDRRAFLARAGAGAAVGGLVWVAPSILTLDAAAAASCGAGGTLNWGSVATGAPGPSSVTVGTVVATISHTDPQGRASTDSFHVVTGTFGGQTNPWYEMQMTGAMTGNLQTATFAFSKAVNNLSFRFFDIDQNANADGTGRWRDVVSIAATGPGGTVTFTPSAQGADITGTGTTANPFVASNGTNAATGSTAGNVTVTFAAPVTSLTITYKAATGTGNTGTGPWDEQRIGIGNMTWNGCT